MVNNSQVSGRFRWFCLYTNKGCLSLAIRSLAIRRNLVLPGLTSACLRASTSTQSPSRISRGGVTVDCRRRIHDNRWWGIEWPRMAVPRGVGCSVNQDVYRRGGDTRRCNPDRCYCRTMWSTKCDKCAIMRLSAHTVAHSYRNSLIVCFLHAAKYRPSAGEKEGSNICPTNRLVWHFVSEYRLDHA